MRLLKVSMLPAMILLFTVSTMAQMTGLDLYNAMGERDFIEYEGQSGVSWLPGDMGYMEVDRDEDGNVTFFKVDPANLNRAPLFEESTLDALIEQYNEATGSDTEVDRRTLQTRHRMVAPTNHFCRRDTICRSCR